MRKARKALVCGFRSAGTYSALLLVAFLSGMQAGERSPVDTLVRSVSGAVHTERALDTVRHVYSTDRWFTFPKFEQTASYLKQRLEESGMSNVEVGGAVADGKTQAGFWTMPLAWDAQQARLEMVTPERETLCDYTSVPASLGMWSGATPPEGITAELVDLPRTKWADVKGKLVLTDKNSASYKFRLVKYGALGAVNGFSENPSLADGRQWVNAWGDNGWGFTKASTPLPSFSVTPKQAQHLRELLAQGKRVTLHATAITKFYSGRYPWVTAVLPGRDLEEEVLAFGHTSEQGAQDNATGVSAVIEALTTLRSLIEQGKLPRPRRSIRVLLMPEMYGSLSYIEQYRDRIRHTLAAMTVDTPAASYDLNGTEYTFYLNPHVAMSYTDGLIKRIAATALADHRTWHWQEQMPGTDSYLGEPTVGVPTVWSYSGTGVVTHHNSEDKPETVDARSMHDLVTVLATYLYFNANAGEQQIPWLADVTLDHVYEEMAATVSNGIDGIRAGRPEAGAYALDRIAYFRDRGEDALFTVLRVVPENERGRLKDKLKPFVTQLNSVSALQSERLRLAGARPGEDQTTAESKKIVVRRKRFGTLPLDDLPQDQWEGYPSGAWDKRIITALYWCDGKRNLSEVIHLTNMELGPTKFDFVGYFNFLQRHGYVDFAD